MRKDHSLFLSLNLFQGNWDTGKENTLPKHVHTYLLHGKDLNLIFHAYLSKN